MFLSLNPPRRALVAYVEPGTPAANAGVTRGMEIISINGVSFISDGTQAGVDVLNAALFPSSAGQTFTFLLRTADNSADVSKQLTTANITHTPVLLDQAIENNGDSVG